ncbi:hypothetical protein B0T19DRAFT_437384 [Cercophora scortea]|uniref:Uncharacterized protein n=1 Tax=Cercophora scortea TaxID=314031 RepID=A0AAE0J473_9PEZI|nr:hypothetical protein B0T19DRAFT_437384 [Cercophora scortea]
MDKRAQLADPRQPVSHLVTHQHYRPPNYRYQYQYPETAHHRLYEQPDYRESLGSDCSVPGMVDDHGSDVSTEDDYQYHAVGTEVWDLFWHAQLQNETTDPKGPPSRLLFALPLNGAPVSRQAAPATATPVFTLKTANCSIFPSSPRFTVVVKLSETKVPTQSSPALRHLAQTQSQDPESTQEKPKLQHFISHAVLERPLPPLPNLPSELGQPSTPQNVSFFDLDSDDDDAGATGEESRSFAKRFMRGFVHSHHRSRDSGKGSHQRSASDSKSDATNTYKTTQTRRARADTTGAVASSHGGSSRSSLRRPDTKEDDKDSRPWLSRQGSDVFGRILGRRGS